MCVSFLSRFPQILGGAGTVRQSYHESSCFSSSSGSIVSLSLGESEREREREREIDSVAFSTAFLPLCLLLVPSSFSLLRDFNFSLPRVTLFRSFAQTLLSRSERERETKFTFIEVTFFPVLRSLLFIFIWHLMYIHVHAFSNPSSECQLKASQEGD